MTLLTSLPKFKLNDSIQNTVDSGQSYSDHSDSVKTSTLSMIDKLRTHSKRKAIRSIVANHVITSMIEKQGQCKQTDLNEISRSINEKQTNKRLQQYVCYRVNKQSNRIKTSINSTDPCSHDSLNKPITMPAAKAGTRYDLVVARDILNPSTIKFYEKPTVLSQQDQQEIEKQGVSLKERSEPIDAVHLGKGSFGEVTLVKEIAPKGKEEGRWQAMKVCKDDAYFIKKEFDISYKLMSNAQVSDDNNPPFITPHAYVPAFTQSNKRPTHTAVFFSELGAGTNLKSDYQDRSPEGRKAILLNLGQSLQKINEYGITHRDIKPGNVLMKDDKPVLIDFGLSEESDLIHEFAGSKSYMAPEILEGSIGRNLPTDIYSMGLLFAKTIGLDHLTSVKEKGSMNMILDKLLDNRDAFINEVTVDHNPKPLHQLISDMIEYDPNRRPDIDKVVATIAGMPVSDFS